jgi:hypothetical protein
MPIDGLPDTIDAETRAARHLGGTQRRCQAHAALLVPSACEVAANVTFAEGHLAA